MIDYSEQFDKERKYRVEVSYHKYGSARKNFGEGRVDAIATAERCIEAFKKDDDECCCGCFDVKELLIMAIATSIDALAVGIAFAIDGIDTLPQILLSILIIGLTTFVLSAFGVLLGHKFGAVYKSKAEHILKATKDIEEKFGAQEKNI